MKSLMISNPATADPIDEVGLADSAELDRVLTLLDSGTARWASTPLHERISCVRRFSALISGPERSRLARLLCAETGKVMRETWEEIGNCSRLFDGYANAASVATGTASRLDSQPGLERDLLMTFREPYGLAAVIIPFNFPAEIFAHKVAPTLIMGNCVATKPSPHAPLTVMELVKLLHQAGVPEDAVQVVNGGSDVGSWIAEDSRVRLLSLTGSTEAGISVSERAAKTLSKVLLELGGNDPVIVLEDANLDAALDAIVAGRLLANGQCCVANKRLLVQDSLYSQFVDRLVLRLEKCIIGDPAVEETDVGPLISADAAGRARDQIRTTLRQGAKLVFGRADGTNAFQPPTVLSDVSSATDVMRDMEIFAPVFPVASFRSDDEAVKLANVSRYGLNCGIFTSDVSRGLQIVAQIQVGLAVINGTSLYHPDIAPFGGYKMSGRGREGLVISLDEVTQPKAVVVRNAFT